jgi:FtsZ-binding cell division protein ZapB
MVTLEQVEQLEIKVRQVVTIVEELRVENERLAAAKRQVEADFNVLRERYEAVTSKAGALEGAGLMVEKGILGAIDLLNNASREYVDNQDYNPPQAITEPYITPQHDGEEYTPDSPQD